MPRKILLADDSVTAQNMGRKILSEAGYEVVTVNNGSAALKKMAELKPDLLVLDVYMPGYSGLEVCQRVKETRETERIPVLLTVGKLEPFKAEEAKKVRADAFIVKPFEASELLTALTKLEDKIVPQAEAPKGGRLARALAVLEPLGAAGSEAEFGDADSGWKDRLKFPSSAPGSPEPEPEMPAPAFGMGLRDRASEKEPPPALASAGFDRPMPAGLPQDITADEIAAIKAAVDEVNGRLSAAAPTAEASADSTPTSAKAKSEPPPFEVVAGEETPVTLAPAPEVRPEAVVDSAPVAQTPPAEITPEPPVVAPAELPVVAPSNGNAAAALKEEEIAAAINTIAAAQELVAGEVTSGAPCWIAEEIPVEGEEATLILEREMEKARTAQPASEGWRESYEPAPVDRNDEPMFAALEAVTAAEVAAEPATAYAAAASAAMTASAAFPAGSAVAPVPEGTACAMAAAAGSEAGVSASAAPLALPASSPESEKADAADEAKQDAELSAGTIAALANWKEIRDSIVGSPLTSQAAEAAGFKDILEKEAPPASRESTAEDAAASDSSAIASIVDSVLAELKPKLMEEIAKKLGKERKK